MIIIIKRLQGHTCASVLEFNLLEKLSLFAQRNYWSLQPVNLLSSTEMGRRRGNNEQEELAQGRQVKALRLVFLLLPPENYQLLHDLLVLLHRVASHQNVNLMSAINLGTMFAPHILCPRKVGTQCNEEN